MLSSASPRDERELLRIESVLSIGWRFWSSAGAKMCSLCHSPCNVLDYFEIVDALERLTQSHNCPDFCPSSSHLQPDPKSDVVCNYTSTSHFLTSTQTRLHK
jgi:hypothetical protein